MLRWLIAARVTLPRIFVAKTQDYSIRIIWRFLRLTGFSLLSYLQYGSRRPSWSDTSLNQIQMSFSHSNVFHTTFCIFAFGAQHILVSSKIINSAWANETHLKCLISFPTGRAVSLTARLFTLIDYFPIFHESDGWFRTTHRITGLSLSNQGCC